VPIYPQNNSTISKHNDSRVSVVIMTIIILAKECYCKYLCSDILALATRKHKHRPDHMTVNIIY